MTNIMIAAMNTVELQLLEFIKESQFGNGNLLFADWNYDAVMKEATIQAVQGIVLSAIPKNLMPEDMVKGKLLDKTLAKYLRYLHEEDKLVRLLNENAIPFVVLKGNAAAMYYKNPSLRSMGDIDFIVKEEDFSQAKEIMMGSGYVLKHDAESDDFRHIAFEKNKVSFELHRKFSHEVDIEDFVMEGLNNRENRVIEGFAFPVLPKLANGLVLLDHMRNHLRRGLGLRQVVDWMMYVNAELDDEFWNSAFGNIAREKGIEKIAIVATKTCQKYLGLPERITWCEAADDELCDSLMKNLLDSGNFGRKNGVGNSFESVSTAMLEEGFFRRLQHVGEYNWKAYKKHHWLKPFAWIYQAFRYAGKGIKTKRNRAQVKADMQKGKERYELLKRLGIVS